MVVNKESAMLIGEYNWGDVPLNTLSFISLQQFVKGCGSFASEMGNAILNSLTNGRHGKFMETLRQKEEKEDKPVKETIVSNITLVNSRLMNINTYHSDSYH